MCSFLSWHPISNFTVVILLSYFTFLLIFNFFNFFGTSYYSIYENYHTKYSLFIIHNNTIYLYFYITSMIDHYLSLLPITVLFIYTFYHSDPSLTNFTIVILLSYFTFLLNFFNIFGTSYYHL